MLCSTPVLSSNSGCSKIIINNFGFNVIKNDYETIFREFQKILTFFNNYKDKWNFIKKNSRLHIQNNFSISNMSKSYLENWTF